MKKFDAEMVSDADCPFKIQRVVPAPFPAEDGQWVIISRGIPAGGPLREKWVASVNVVPHLDGSTIVRVNEIEADFYTDTPEEMKRILTAHGYPTEKMLIIIGGK